MARGSGRRHRLRVPHHPPGARLCRDAGPDARDRDRRQHRDLHADRRCRPPRAAGPAPEGAGGDRRPVNGQFVRTGVESGRDVVSAVPRRSRSRRLVHRCARRGACESARCPHRRSRRRARASEGTLRLRKLLLGARRTGLARPRVRRFRGRRGRRLAGRHHQPWLLDSAVPAGFVHRRQSDRRQ